MGQGHQQGESQWQSASAKAAMVVQLLVATEVREEWKTRDDPENS